MEAAMVASTTSGKESLYRQIKLKMARSIVIFSTVAIFASAIAAQFVARDPGVRDGSVDAGQPLYLTPTPGATTFFTDGQDRFQEIDDVAGGLGPRFNTNQ